MLALYVLQGQTDNSDLLKIIAETLGGLTATFSGVYLSLHISRKQDQEKEEKSANETMLGNLKVIWAELKMNEDILNHFMNDGLKKMPKIVTELFNQQTYLMSYLNGLKYVAFYSTMSSGAINIISKHVEIFNALQFAYYNTELTQNSLNTTTLTFKDYLDPVFANQNPDLVNNAFGLVNQEINKTETTIKLIKKAKDLVQSYLISNGVTFTEEELFL